MCMPSLPNYILAEKLGKGSNATVFKAHKKGDSKKTFAIKCIYKKVLNKIGSDNLVSEISILKDISHEYIVQLFDFTWDSNFIYIILEFCPGGDLYSYIKKHNYLDETIVRRFLQQLAVALQFLYEKSILHMDLKPSNILLTSTIRPKLKLADFGFAKCIEGTVNIDYLRGSLLYMAPEVYSSGLYSAKCDLWSVGVIIYECLIGRAPFYSESLVALKQKIIDESPVDIPLQTPNGTLISENCYSLISGLLRRNVDDRMSYEDFLHHPFVDIQHAPSNKSLEISMKILYNSEEQEESWRDQNSKSSIGPRKRRIQNLSNLRKVYDSYVDGLCHLIAAIQYEESEVKRNNLRELLVEKLAHVEQLQEELNSLNKNAEFLSSRSLSNEDSLNILEIECHDSEILKEKLEDLKTFYDLIEKNDLKNAVDKFITVFETLYSFIKDDTNKHRKQIFLEELEYAMSIAEDAKQSLRNTDMKSLRKNTDSINICVIS